MIDIAPDVLFLLSGTGQAPKHPGMAWGNGFVTDLDTINAYNLSDPVPFFLDLAVAPQLVKRTILSPHLRGPSATVNTRHARHLLDGKPPHVMHRCTWQCPFVSRHTCVSHDVDRNRGWHHHITSSNLVTKLLLSLYTGLDARY